jgi:endonuclease/exonuclease/phosphatase family metal-dependent hydrolase
MAQTILSMVKKYFLLPLLLFLITYVANAQEKDLIIATFNIRYDNPQDDPNTWENRQLAVSQLIHFHGFDIFGIQEGLRHQVKDLENLLPNFNFVGVGRDDGKEKGEYSAIFYRKDKFKVKKTSTFWLAPETDHPNKGWDAALPRICTWAKMEETETGREFYAFNTHFDHRGVEARKQSAALILEKIKAINKENLPVFLMGDFNVDQTTEAYHLLQNAPGMKDTYKVADFVYANNGSTNSFDLTKSTERIIDHIFVSESVKVKKYGLLTDTYHNRFPSDHFPVMAIIAW